MKHILLIISVVLFPLLLFGQGDTLFFSNAIKVNFRKYKRESTIAYRQRDTERTQFLFDSLVDNRLAGTIFDDFILKKAGSGKLKLSDIKKPVIILTYASWCVPSPGEIPALNKLAQKYGKDVKFVVLFWDKKQNARKLAKEFSAKITVCYAHESYRNDMPIISAMKHKLGLNTSFYLDESLKVIDIRRCGVNLCPRKTEYEKAFALNYNSFLDGLATIIMGIELSKEHLAVH